MHEPLRAKISCIAILLLDAIVVIARDLPLLNLLLLIPRVHQCE